MATIGGCRQGPAAGVLEKIGMVYGWEKMKFAYKHGVNFTSDEFTIPENHPHAEELRALKLDAKKARAQARELMKLNATNIARYESQLESTLDLIDRQAEKLL